LHCICPLMTQSGHRQASRADPFQYMLDPWASGRPANGWQHFQELFRSLLSRGAARELDTALQVDPNDIEDITRQIAAALLMSREERCARWQNMMDVLLRHSIDAWFADFMRALKTSRPSLLAPARVPLPVTAGRAVLAHPRRQVPPIRGRFVCIQTRAQVFDSFQGMCPRKL
jgi:uncharacterized protein (DUF2235 family)